MIIKPGVEWSGGEAASLNEFLNTPLGKKALWVLLMLKPHVDLTSTDKAALTGAFAAGYEHMLNEIAALRTSRQEDTASAKTIDMTKD